jgi:hypothetical protein
MNLFVRTRMRRSARLDSAYDKLEEWVVHKALKHKGNDWPVYFSALRDETRKMVAQSDITKDLTRREKDDLTIRLLSRIDKLERWWPAPKD